MSPSAMKQMSWLSGLSATARPALGRLARAPGPWSCRRAGTSPGPAARWSARRARRTGPWPGPRCRDQPRATVGGPSRAWWPVQTASKPSATARSSTAANLIFSLQRRHGLGVWPRAYSSTKSSHHVVRGTARPCPRRRTGCRSRRRPGGRPARPRACSSRGRRSGRTAGSRTAPGARRSRRGRPSAARAAATAESTPPDMAASTRSVVIQSRLVPGISVAASRAPAARPGADPRRADQPGRRDRAHAHRDEPARRPRPA